MAPHGVAQHEIFVRDRADPMHVERVLPDYTWPQRMPLEQLRRQIAREMKEAAELARALFPQWSTTP